jgi:ABC-2 type transport system ATP-binding protein/lipopolysaccharide transport system ATP-binding protein
VTAVEVRDVSKRYLLGERPGLLSRFTGRRDRPVLWALRDVSFTVEEGEAVGIVGRNGAGKTTLLRVLARITEPTSGLSRVRGRVGCLLEVGAGFHPELTGRENVFLSGAVLGMRTRDVARRFDEIVEFAGLARFIDTPVKRYSSGMYVRLAFAVAAHLEPDVLVVDEVLAVGDAEFQRRCVGRMLSAEREGRTVLFVSHDLETLVRLCGRAIWLDAGRVRADGRAVDVVDRYLADVVRPVGRRRFPDVGRPAALVSAAVVADGVGPAAVLRRDRPFALEVHFRLRERLPGIDLAAVVTTTSGVRVLDEALSRGGPVNLGPGEHVARLSVPPVLRAGDYLVSLWLGTGLGETLQWEETALSFRLAEEGGRRTTGVVDLAARWHVAPAGEAAAR